MANDHEQDLEANMNKAANPSTEETKARMQAVLDRQKAAQTSFGPPSLAMRKDRLKRAISMILLHKEELLDAMNADFGARSRDMGMLYDIVGAVQPLREAHKRVAKWMRPQRRKVSPAILGLLGARSTVRYQPKGVIGIVTSWNFPVQLIMDAVAAAFASGNRVMLKPSEFTPATASLLAQLFDSHFDADEVSVFLGGPEIAAAFTSLPFDHLIFTGSTNVGRHVMRSAADNLTPVTLELGGKSPVVIGRSADLTKTAARVMMGKMMNAGQVCVAPDYAIVPDDRVEAFITAATAATAKMYPTLKENPDYASIITQRHYDRLRGLIDDARRKGARIIEINPAKEDFSQQQHRRMPPTLIVDATNDMAVMQEEIFGPIMPIKRYSAIDDAISAINAGPRPLALYYFGTDKSESENLLERTHAGGVTINDIFWHIAMHDLPFGGIGPSGMGAYHGHRGFLEFSHEKAVYHQTLNEIIAMFRPPYGAKYRKTMQGLLK
jgi:coniferyl-aldehyde dehydrogenase